LQGSLKNAYVPASAGGVWLVSSQIPVQGGVTTVLGYKPNIGDTIYMYTNGAYSGYVYNKSGHPTTTNWLSGSTVTEPVINVGQGFWLKTAAAGTVWTNNFIVP
jgi:hypothetical protein